MKTAIFILLLFIGFMPESGAQYVRVRAAYPAGISLHASGPRPYAGAVWIGPEWQWRGGQYVCVPGHWARPHRHGAVWVPGHWKHSRRGYRWIPGHWR